MRAIALGGIEPTKELPVEDVSPPIPPYHPTFHGGLTTASTHSFMASTAVYSPPETSLTVTVPAWWDLEL